MHRLCTGLVAEAAFVPALLRPSPVAIHDDCHVPGYPVKVYFFSIYHLLVLYFEAQTVQSPAPHLVGGAVAAEHYPNEVALVGCRHAFVLGGFHDYGVGSFALEAFGQQEFLFGFSPGDACDGLVDGIQFTSEAAELSAVVRQEGMVYS